MNKSPVKPDVPDVPPLPVVPCTPLTPLVPDVPDVPLVPDEPAVICDCKKSKLASISAAVSGEFLTNLLVNAIIFSYYNCNVITVNITD